jgi:DNA gyrase subunit B/topoisomerase-4 subunit B
VGTKAVNALSKDFRVRSVREGQFVEAWFKQGKLKKEKQRGRSTSRMEPYVEFEPDPEIFKETEFKNEFIARRLRHYSYLNTG